MSTSSFADGIANASTGDFWIPIGLGLAVTLGCFAGAFIQLKRKRFIEDTPTALIRSAPQGYVELTGHAEMMDGEPIYASLSMRPCVWYHYHVEQRRQVRTGKTTSTSWITVESNTSEDLFHLVDATGKCAVDPEGATVTPSERDVWYGNTRIPGRADAASPLIRFIGVGQLGRNYRYSEERIGAGDPLYILGNFTTHGGAATAFNKDTEISRLLREWKRDRANLLARFDADNDGETDLQEWQTARAAAEREVLSQRGREAVAPPVDVVGRTPDNRRPFILAARTEGQMVAKYRWSALGLFVLSLLGSAILAWAFSIRLAG